MIRRATTVAMVASVSMMAAAPGAVHTLAAARDATTVRAAVEPGGPVPMRAPVGASGTQTTGPVGFGPPNATMPWNLDRIDQRTSTPSNSYSWDADGTGVTVYVADSGVRANHAEFGSRVAAGWSYRTDATLMSMTNASSDSCKADPDYDPNDHQYDVDTFDFPNPLPTTSQDKGWLDNDGHGTHVAGTVGGNTTGVAKGVTIVPVRILSSCGTGQDEWFVAGLDWILNNHEPGTPAVVNLSVGTGSVDAAVNAKIDELVDAGIVVVGAAGNGKPPTGGGANVGVDACTVSPGSAAKAIIVGSSNSTDAESSYSNYGACVDLIAPGTMVVSAYPYQSGVANPYAGMSGTSMATPAVAGAVALRLQASPTDTPAQVLQWLTSRATGCAITAYDTSRVVQSPNLLLNVFGAAGVPCAPRMLEAVAGNKKFNVSWFPPVADNGAAITGYTAVASPGGASCTATGTSCTISNVTPGVAYTVSVTAVNSAGTSPAATTTATAVGVPDSPTALSARGTNGAVTFSWVASPGATSYTVRNIINGKTCTTTSTTCTITGLRNGSSFTYRVTATASDGQTSAAANGSARAGFTVRATKVRKGSSTSLSKVVTTPSRGTKRWSAKGGCRVSGTSLVAPAKKATCTLTLSVAKSGSFPAATTTVTVLVS